MHKDLSIEELVEFVNTGGLSRHKIFTNEEKSTTSSELGCTTTLQEIDSGIIYWETGYNLFCRAHRINPTTGNSLQIQPVVQLTSQPVVQPSKVSRNKKEIKELCKTKTQKEVAKLLGVSQQYISKVVNAR